jgi:hypothetical protein
MAAVKSMPGVIREPPAPENERDGYLGSVPWIPST